MSYSLYKQASCLIKSALDVDNNPYDLEIEDVPEQPINNFTAPGVTTKKEVNAQPRTRSGEDASTELANEPLFSFDELAPLSFDEISPVTNTPNAQENVAPINNSTTNTNPVPIEPIYGLTNALETNQENVNKNVVGYYQPPGLVTRAVDYFFKPVIAADAYKSLTNKANWGKDYNWTKFLSEAKNMGPVGKLIGRGINIPFIPLGALSAYGDFKKARNTDDPITSAGYKAKGIADGVTTASALGQIIHTSPKLAEGIAVAAKHGLRGSKWIGASKLIHGLRPLARLAPFMGPAMAIEMALEGGLAARERLMRGIEAYKHLPSNVASNYIAQKAYTNTDAEGNVVPSMSAYAPATAAGIGVSLRRAAQYPNIVPAKPNTLGMLWSNLKNAGRYVMGIPTIDPIREVEEKQRNALNYAFPSNEVIKQNMPEGLRGKDPSEEKIKVDGTPIPGSALVNQTSAIMHATRPNNSWARALGNIWDAGKQGVAQAALKQKSVAEQAEELRQERLNSPNWFIRWGAAMENMD